MVYFSFFLGTLLLYIWKIHSSFKGHKLPPGPIRWPIIGSIPQMLLFDRAYPYRQLMGLQKKFGDIVSLGFGIHYAVVISKFEIMQDLLTRPETTLKRFNFQFSDLRTNGGNLGIISSYDETWTEVRKFTVKQLRQFGFGKSGSIASTVHEEATALMRHIRDLSQGSDSIWRVDSNRLSAISINVLWSCVSGYRFDPSSDFMLRQFAINTETREILRPTNNILSALPFLKIFPQWSGYRRHQKLVQKSRECIQNFINDAKRQRVGRVEEPNSFIEVFLDEIEKCRNVPGTHMTENQLELVLMDLFLAGTETISAVMNWMILYFTMNPNVQNRARNEVMKMSENGTKQILLTQNKEMPYVSACILETMRHSPFGSVPLPREASCDIFYDNYVIPKGTCVLNNLYAVFHDEHFWGDPQTFRPERLLDSCGTTLSQEKVERIAQFGFGVKYATSGKRICPAEHMAMDILFGFATTLLATFHIETVAGDEPSYEPGTPALTIRPIPYVARFTPLH